MANNHKVHDWLIGASLNEPHTSVTVFGEVVCMSAYLWPYTVNVKYFMKTERPRSLGSFVDALAHCRVGEGLLQSAASA